MGPSLYGASWLPELLGAEYARGQSLLRAEMSRNRSKAMSLLNLLFAHFCCCARYVGGFCFESLVVVCFLLSIILLGKRELVETMQTTLCQVRR